MSAYPKEPADRKGKLSFWPAGNDTPSETVLKNRLKAEGLSPALIAAFQDEIYCFFRQQQRVLPWRESATPYQILVSEVMLQQTQVERVLPKYLAFMQQFPDPQALAAAPLPELLAAWQGLGYNRRALNLQRAARMVVEQWNGSIPDDPVLLQRLPGIGPYTAGAVSSFAFNRPNVFLETNIRAVLLHFFFSDQQGVTDKQLLPVAKAVLDRKNPRDWYNALMDYGSHLKRRFPNLSRRSRHHTAQSRFEGSDRQTRGAVLRLLLKQGSVSVKTLQKALSIETNRLTHVLDGLVRDGLVKKEQGTFAIPSA